MIFSQGKCRKMAVIMHRKNLLYSLVDASKNIYITEIKREKWSMGLNRDLEENVPFS